MNDGGESSGDEVPMDDATRAAATEKIARLQKKLRSLTEADISVVNIEIRVGRPSLLGPARNVRVVADSDPPGSTHPQVDGGDEDPDDPVDEDALTTMD